MGRRSVKISRRNLAEIPTPLRCCALWEPQPNKEPAEALAAVTDAGGGGRIVYVDGEVAAFGIYVPTGRFDADGAGDPGHPDTPTHPGDPAEREAAVLMAARVLPAYAGGGIGKMLLQSICKDALRQRHETLEAVADAQGTEGGCVLPAATLAAAGFRTVEPHPRYPKLRLDLGGVLTWREDLEDTVERWLRALDPHRGRGDERPGAAGAGLGRVSR